MMARVRYTQGMSITEIIDKGYNYFAQLDEKALREAVGRLGSVVNKRYRTITDEGDKSPATTALERSGGKISTRGKSVEELRDEYGRALNYLNSETSTLARWKVVKQKTIDVMKRGNDGEGARKIPGINIDIENYNAFWQAYGELVKTDRRYRDKEYKYEAMERLQKTMERKGNEDKSPEEIARLVTDQFRRAYEAKERAYNDRNSGTAQFIRRRQPL